MALALALVGCGVKKKAVVSDQAPVVSEPAWHTCLMQGGKAAIDINGDRLISAPVTMQTVRDSLIIISVYPMLGIEMARFEATPTDLTGFNKLEGTYATITYAELNRVITPKISWEILQQTCSGELPTGDQKARLEYMIGDKTFELTIVYPTRQLDVPVKTKRMNPNKYKKVDISKWL